MLVGSAFLPARGSKLDESGTLQRLRSVGSRLVRRSEHHKHRSGQIATLHPGEEGAWALISMPEREGRWIREQQSLAAAASTNRSVGRQHLQLRCPTTQPGHTTGADQHRNQLCGAMSQKRQRPSWCGQSTPTAYRSFSMIFMRMVTKKQALDDAYIARIVERILLPVIRDE